MTSVIGGNCGFTLAPLKAGRRRLHPADDGQGGGHAPRRPSRTASTGSGRRSASTSMGSRVASGSTPGSWSVIAPCAATCWGPRPASARRRPTSCPPWSSLLNQSLDAGGLGLSTSRSSTHNDGDDKPVPSRAASEDELLTLCRTVGQHPGTTLEAIVEGCLDGFSGDEIELMAAMSAAGQPPAQLERPVRAGLGYRQDRPAQLLPSERARQIGGPGGGPDHADLRRQQHEPGHVLRPVADPRLARRAVACPWPRRRSSCTTPRCGPDGGWRPRGRCSSGWPTSPTTASATPSPRRTASTRGG